MWMIQSRGSHFIGIIADEDVNSFYSKMIKKEINNLSLQMCPEVPFLLAEKDKLFQVVDSSSNLEYPFMVYKVDKNILNKKGTDALLNKKSKKIESKKDLDLFFQEFFGDS